MSQQKILGLFCCFFLVLQQLSAQNAKVDSLLHVLTTLSPEDNDYKIQKADLLHQLLEIRINTEPKAVLLLQIDSLAMLYKETKNDKAFMEVSLQKKALVLSNNNENIEALSLYRKYMEYLSKVGREKENGYFYIDIGNLYVAVRLYKSACNYYKKAIAIFTAEQNTNGLATSYSCYSLTAQYANDFEASAQYAQLAFELRVKGESDQFSRGYQHFVLGMALTKTKKIQEAKEQHRLGLQLFSDSSFFKHTSYSGLKVYPINCAIELVLILREEEKFDSAQYYLQIAKDLMILHQANSSGLAMYIQRIEMLTLAFQKKYPPAIKLAQDLLKQFASMPASGGTTQRQYYTLKDICQMYGLVGDSAKLYEYSYRAEQLYKTFEKNTEQDKLLEINNIVLQMENEQTISAQQQSILEKEQAAAQDSFFRRVLMGIILGIGLILLIIGGLAWQLKRQNKLIQNYATQMEKSDQNKALLLSVIGHDLRAPFNTIFRSLQLANLKEIEANVKKHLDQIAVASRGAFVMLDNLMQWISVQKEDFKTKEKSTSLAVLFKEILQPIEALALDNQIVIQQELEIEFLDCDKELLQIILRNLLFNAIKYSFAQGTVSIKTYLKEDQVCLSIANDGGQVATDFLNEIKSLQNNRNIAQKGSGLGLVLVQTIAQKLGIQFMIENQKKGGVMCTLIFKKGINYSENSTKSAPLKKEIEAIKWTSDEQDYIQKMSLKLKEHPIFEATEIKKILEEQHEGESKNIQQWKKEIAQAVYKMDEEVYQELINLIC